MRQDDHKCRLHLNLSGEFSYIFYKRLWIAQNNQSHLLLVYINQDFFELYKLEVFGKFAEFIKIQLEPINL